MTPLVTVLKAAADEVLEEVAAAQRKAGHPIAAVLIESAEKTLDSLLPLIAEKLAGKLQPVAA